MAETEILYALANVVREYELEMDGDIMERIARPFIMPSFRKNPEPYICLKKRQ